MNAATCSSLATPSKSRSNSSAIKDRTWSSYYLSHRNQSAPLVDLYATTFTSGITKENRAAVARSCASLARVRGLNVSGLSSYASLALFRADRLIDGFADLLSARGFEFRAPHVTLSSDDEVCLEWWKGIRKLTVYVAADGMQLLKTWGADIEKEMTDEPFTSVRVAVDAWRWLRG